MMTFNRLLEQQDFAGSLLYAADDGLYLGGRGTIYRWDYEQAALDTVALQWKEPSRAFFNRMARWNERYWVLSSRWNGLWLLDRRTGVIDRPDFCREKEIMAMEVDHRGNLWISPMARG